MAPLLIAGARARGYDPRPFLIALVAGQYRFRRDLISSPQKIYLGQIGNLSFHTFLLVAGCRRSSAGGGVRGHLVPVARSRHRHGIHHTGGCEVRAIRYIAPEPSRRWCLAGAADLFTSLPREGFGGW